MGGNYYFAEMSLISNLSDGGVGQRRGVAQGHFLSRLEISRGHDNHPHVGVEELPGVGDAVVVDPSDGRENGPGSNPVPADLVAIGVQDAADLLDLVAGEPPIQEELLVQKLDHVHLREVTACSQTID